MNTEDFKGFGLIEPIMRALEEEKFSTPTPIQKETIPLILAGKDVMGCAQTGSGKTAAYALPMLQSLHKTQTSPVRRSVRALVVAPTRELADQIAGCFTSFGRHLNLSVAVVYGGVGKGDQIDRLHQGVDVLVATPGRLLDLMEQGRLVLARTQILVLDEADRMLDMGFIPDIKRIVMALPSRRQSMLFSATIPPMIVGLAANILDRPHHIEIASIHRNDPQIEQKVLFVRQNKKNELLLQLLADRAVSRALVFTRTKHRANSLARELSKKRVKSDALHGDKSQSERLKALASFHAGHIQVLVATDLASRGLDVDDIDHVINYELPNEPEVYIHRIGRTARAGKRGIALSFCDRSEMVYLRQIEKTLNKKLPVWEDHPFHSPEEAGAPRGTESGGRHGSGGYQKSRGPGSARQGGGKRRSRKPGGGSRKAPGAPSRSQGRGPRTQETSRSGGR